MLRVNWGSSKAKLVSTVSRELSTTGYGICRLYSRVSAGVSAMEGGGREEDDEEEEGGGEGLEAEEEEGGADAILLVIPRCSVGGDTTRV